MYFVRIKVKSSRLTKIFWKTQRFHKMLLRKTIWNSTLNQCNIFYSTLVFYLITCLHKVAYDICKYNFRIFGDIVYMMHVSHRQQSRKEIFDSQPYSIDVLRMNLFIFIASFWGWKSLNTKQGFFDHSWLLHFNVKIEISNKNLY